MNNWTEEEKGKLVRFIEQGVKIKHIAILLDRSDASTFKWAARLMPRRQAQSRDSSPLPKQLELMKTKRTPTLKQYKENPDKFWQDKMEGFSFYGCNRNEAYQLQRIKGAFQ